MKPKRQKEERIIKVSIVHNNEKKTMDILPILIESLQKHHVELDAKYPDVVISVGGDGTFLSAFHRFNHRLNEVRFVGIHTGHLGFYTDWRDFEIEEMVISLKQLGNTKEAVSYPLLDVLIEYDETENCQHSHFLALNESVIRGVGKTMVSEVFIDGDLFESFRGDGLVVSTPTGSTAYNKSIGGAILHPKIDAFQFSELASLNNIVFRTLGSPVVIHREIPVQLKLNQQQDYFLTVDQLELPKRHIRSITYKIAKERIRFMPTRHLPFFTRVKEAFIGEVN